MALNLETSVFCLPEGTHMNEQSSFQVLSGRCMMGGGRGCALTVGYCFHWWAAHVMLVHASACWQWHSQFQDQGNNPLLGIAVVGPIEVPWWLYRGCWQPYRTPVTMEGGWQLPAGYPMHAAYGNLVGPGSVFSLYAGLLLTRRWTVVPWCPSDVGHPSSWCDCPSAWAVGSED